MIGVFNASRQALRTEYKSSALLQFVVLWI